MNLEEYSKIIEKTAVFPREVEKFGIAYCWLGIQDELRELYDKVDQHDWSGIPAEQGDVMWYLCALCKETGLSFPELMEPFIYYYDKRDWKHITREDIFMKIATFSGNIKKFYRDNKALNMILLGNVLEDIIHAVLYQSTKEEIKEVLQLNYEKLIARRATNTLHGDGDYREKRNEETEQN